MLPAPALHNLQFLPTYPYFSSLPPHLPACASHREKRRQRLQVPAMLSCPLTREDAIIPGSRCVSSHKAHEISSFVPRVSLCLSGRAMIVYAGTGDDRSVGMSFLLKNSLIKMLTLPFLFFSLAKAHSQTLIQCAYKALREKKQKDESESFQNLSHLIILMVHFLVVASTTLSFIHYLCICFTHSSFSSSFFVPFPPFLPALQSPCTSF